MNRVLNESGWVSVGGANLRYIVEGNGIPSLVIGSSVYYPRTFSQKLREAFRLAFIDVRHFAEVDASCSLHNITLGTYLDDIEEARNKAGFERAVVIGHSHHGNLALEYAKRYPAKVSHVVLIGSPPCDVKKTIDVGKEYWDEHASDARKEALRENWTALKPDVLKGMSPKDAFIATYVADGPKCWYDSAYDASPLWQGMPINMDIIKVFRDFFADYELSWDPTQLTAPVLVVMGRYDYVVPHILWSEVLPKLRNVEFRLFERSGHSPQMEEPKLFDRVLLEWIAGESAAPGERYR